LFVDTASGALDERPQLARVLDQLRPGDTLVVWKLDRLGRSLRHLIDTIADLERRAVGFRSLQENIDTTTPGGKLIFHIFGALAEFERDLIRQRTLAGLASARARGRTGGRPPSMTPTKIALARQLYDSRQHSLAEIARNLASVGLRFTATWQANQVQRTCRQRRTPYLSANLCSDIPRPPTCGRRLALVLAVAAGWPRASVRLGSVTGTRRVEAGQIN